MSAGRHACGRCSSENLVLRSRSAQLPDLAFQFREVGSVCAGRAGGESLVSLGALDSGPQGLGVHISIKPGAIEAVITDPLMSPICPSVNTLRISGEPRMIIGLVPVLLPRQLPPSRVQR